MQIRRLTNRGVAFLTVIVLLSSASVIVLFFTSKAVVNQTGFARRSWHRQQFNNLLDPWISVVLTDLQLASRYPESISLPAHPLSFDSTVPCATKDAATGGKFTLDAFLLPANTKCPLPNLPKTGSQEPWYNAYSANPKTYTYPKELVTMEYFKNNANAGLIVAETDPTVTLSRMGTSAPDKYAYKLKIEFEVCEEPVPGRVVSAPADSERTLLKLPWPSSCPAKKKRKFLYSGIINVDTPFFQSGTEVPGASVGIVTRDPCSSGYAGAYDGAFAFTLTNGDVVDGGYTMNLSQVGTQITGTWSGGTGFSGTLSGTEDNMSMVWEGNCTGTLTGSLDLATDGCFAQGSFSGGPLAGSFTDPDTGNLVTCASVSQAQVSASKNEP